MDPVLKAVLLSWNWRPSVILVLALAGTFYLMGWVRIRRLTAVRRAKHPGGFWDLSAPWRPIAYLGGLFLLALALISPIDPLSEQLFLVHMIQHLLMNMFAPPLLLIADPMPFILWGLPLSARLAIGRMLSRAFNRQTGFRGPIQTATSPGFLWLLASLTLIAWHDPTLYNTALTYRFVHDLEHITFFLTSMLFWWNIIGAAPRIQAKFPIMGRVAVALAAVLPTMLIGVTLAFVTEPIYTFYTAVPRLWGISVMDDQQISGVIMWIPGSMMYVLAALILMAKLLGQEEVKPPLPEGMWGSDDSLAAPGLKKT